jgi:DNA-binding winged helix-turn-helix (wHTH) protein/Tol biopolymer transport system component
MDECRPEHNGSAKQRFGVFEFDPQSGELTKHGIRLKVQAQPIQILRALLQQPGQIVPREELQRRLWPAGTFVEYEQSLNKAVNKLREALADSSDHPVYIETLPRRGYRFLAPVEMNRTPITTAQPIATPQRVLPKLRVLPGLIGGGLLLAIFLGLGLWPAGVPQVERVVQLTNDFTMKVGMGRLICDGSRVLYGDGNEVWSVSASGGEPKRLPLPFLRNADIKVLADYAPLRQQMLLVSPYTGKAGRNELWLASTQGERPHKVGELTPPVRGALAPNAERLAVSMPDGIYIQSIETGERKRVRAMAGMSPMVWWHSSGHIVGFLDPPGDAQKARAWQVDDKGMHVRRIVPETEQGQGAGAWSQDGKRFFYLGGEGEIFLRMEPSMVGWLRKPSVTRLTASGQFRSAPAVDPGNPKRLYAVGSVLRGETMRYDRESRRWVPFLTGFTGEQIDRSPDGRWLAYIAYPSFELHKCRVDGSEDLVLAPGVRGLNPKWSPDGKQIAFSGRPANTSVKFKLWLVSSGGGDAAPYAHGIDSGYDTIWSGDGKRILLGQDDSAQSRIRILHLDSGKIESVAGSERLFSPRWSPGEKQMLALEVNTGRPFLFDDVKGEWRQFGRRSFGYPQWSRNGRYVYSIHVSGGVTEAFRMEVVTGRYEEIARTNFTLIENGNDWLGWTENWEPLTLRDLSSTQVYRIDLDR